MNNNSLTTTRDWTNVPAVPPAAIPPAALYSSYSPENTVRPQTGSVLEYGALIWRSKTLFAACITSGLAIAVVILALQAPVYRARTTLEMQDMNQNFVDMKLASPIADPAASDALTNIQTQIKILQSDTLIDSAIKKAGITSAADLNPRQHDASRWAGIVSLGGSEQPRETLVEIAGKHLKVSVAGQTRIIEVSFDAPRPELAARFANALTSEFIDQNSQARWQMNRQTSEWLAAQLNELRDKLEGSEKGLEDYARKQSLIYTGDQQTVSEEKLRQLQAELSKAQEDRVYKQSRFEMARSARPDTLPDVLNDANLRALETSLTDLRRQEAQLGVMFTGDYSKTKKLHAEAAALEDAISRQRAEIVSRIANELTEAQRREQLLSAAYADQTLRVTHDSEKSIQYDVLKREVDTNRQIYEAMLQRVKEATIAAAIKASNVRVIDPALPPLHPYKPNWPLGSVAGLLGGGIFGLLAIVLRARTDPSVQEPGDAGTLLGIPELGVIPRAQVGSKAPAIVTLVRRDNEIESSNTHLIGPGNSLEVADGFRAVLASIIFAGAKEGQRVLVITSAGSGEGKTTAAANLAITLAKMNRKVLLIDGDIRRPRLHDIFGLDNTIGVTELLGQANLKESVLDSAVLATMYPNLYVLPAGPAAVAGADLLFSTSMPSLIGRYRERFDMVLIDTPPLLSMADARVLGRMSDAVILVARAGQTSRTAVQAAFRRLVDDQSHVLGVILNDWNVNSSAYKYYGGYKYTTEYTGSKPNGSRAS